MPETETRTPAVPFHRRRRARRLWIAIGALLAAVLALVRVTVIEPPITVRWRADLSAADRDAAERRYRLRNAELVEGTTWRYDVGDRSEENLAALVRDPAVEDTGHLDRVRLTLPDRSIRVTMRGLPFPFSTDTRFEDARQLLQVQSVWLLVLGTALLVAARAVAMRMRRNIAVAVLVLVGAAAYACPIEPSGVRMGDAHLYMASRSNFETTAGVHEIHFQAHLTQATLGQLYRAYGETDDAPARAVTTMMRAATAWFIVCALIVGVLERWSPTALRYLGLALLAPCALLFFGWREFGYLSLSMATFPLLVHGLQARDIGLESAAVMAGLSAALHGFGVLSIIGMLLAACTARASLQTRSGDLIRIAVWSTAAYLGWIAVYVIVLNLPVIPGHAENIPWRPWFVDEVRDGRINAAIFSTIGGRDLLMTGWVVGAPLLLVAPFVRQMPPDHLRAAMAYALPSTLFVVLFWPVQGLSEELDLVAASFPAVYALIWMCAHEPKRTRLAAILLASAHIAFWRIALDARFINWMIP